MHIELLNADIQAFIASSDASFLDYQETRCIPTGFVGNIAKLNERNVPVKKEEVYQKSVMFTFLLNERGVCAISTNGGDI